MGCVSSCLYLVTLERSYDGTPVLATRGALAGGAAATVRLPDIPWSRPGSYRFTVWAVARRAPGPVSVVRSPELDAG